MPDMVVDKTFLSYIDYVTNGSLDNIENNMKRNMSIIRSNNPQYYADILRCYQTFYYWGKLDPENNVYELLENRSRALKENHHDFLWLYGRLSDYRSKRTLLGIVENWLTLSMVSLSRIIETTFNHYFDLDVFKCHADEVVVDLGAYIGTTVKDYLASYTGYKRIYCYEIVPETFQKLQDNLAPYPNIVFRQKGAGDVNGVMYITDQEPDLSMHKLSDSGSVEVPVVKIDDDILEPITFIKMDIEGGEQQAIIGCRNHIQTSHPKLAISVYHNNEDIWKIPRMIDEMDSSYRFYLRYNGGHYFASEYVLLGV
ncbi:MAG: FkbM family methyltransferase [Peptococcaceae bacterium]|nr:FkbM family methyltransferase [Peptococcaceae bacterium]